MTNTATEPGWRKKLYSTAAPDIDFVNLHTRQAIADLGEVVPVTNFFAGKIEVQDVGLADRFVCGSDAVGWFPYLIADFGPEIESVQ